MAPASRHRQEQRTATNGAVVTLPAVVSLLLLTAVSAFANEPVAVGSDRAPMHAGREAAPKLSIRTLRPRAVNQVAPSFRWAVLDTERYLAEDAVRDRIPGVPMRVGVNRAVPGVPLNAQTDGEWNVEPGGARVWRLVLQDPGAVAIRLHFSNFDLPSGSTVLVRGVYVYGDGDVYRARGPSRRGTFWAAAVPGDTVYVEYRDPSGASRDPLIEINEISHLYRSGSGIDADRGEAAVSSALLPCHVDVNCENVDSNARDAVGRLEFTVSGGGTFKCSGALLNDADENTYAGYLLTARHCIADQDAADSLTVYWFYQTATCNGAVPDLFALPRSQGAVFLGGVGQADSTLLRLRDDPRDGQGFAAWTTEDPEVGTTITAVHHPDGTFKRHAAGPVTISAPICTELSLVNYFYNKWSPGHGVSEPGSSGAPMFNEQWEVVGQLFGVCFIQQPGCSNQNFYNAVGGRFSRTHPSISSFLSTITPDDEMEDNDGISTAADLSEGTYDLILVDLDDYFRVPVVESRRLVAAVAFDPGDMDVELSLVHESGEVIAAAVAEEGFAEVFAEVLPGDYFVRASKIGGWGGAYALEVQSEASTCAAVSGPEPEPAAQAKNRYISFVPHGNGGSETAIGVRLVALNRAGSDGSSGGESEFSSFENAVRYVGAPVLVNDAAESPPSFHVAPLQCTPYFTDWSSFGTIHVYGRDILPGSTYTVAHLHPDCTPSNPGNYSASVEVGTRIWGDMVAPFGPATGQPNFADISAVVLRFVGLPGAISKLRAQLQPDPPNPSANVSFADINLAVGAFQGSAYPFNGPQDCP